MRKTRRGSALLLMGLLLTTVLTPVGAYAADTGVNYIRAIDHDGDGIADEYIYYTSNDTETDHYAESSIFLQSFTTFGAEDTLKHVPADPVPSTYGGTDEEESLAFYPTYGEWVYNVIDENSKQASIIAYLGTATEVVIPSALDGYTITSLSFGIFTRVAPFIRKTTVRTGDPHAKTVTSVTIPDTVHTVSAFLEDTSVETVHLPAGITNANGLGEDSMLKTITVAADNPNFTVVDGVLYDKDVTEIIVYPPAKTETVYTLPTTLKSLGNSSFAGASIISSFALAGESDCFSVRDGVLYNKAGTELVRYPMAKADEAYTTPAGVTAIGEEAFNDTEYLKNIVLSEGVLNLTRINHNNNIETISLPSTLRYTDLYESVNFDSIFYQLFDLTSISVSAENPYICSEDGVLYDIDKTILYAYPMKKAGTTFTMPSTVTTATANSFWNNRYIETLILPEGFTDFNIRAELMSGVNAYEVDASNSVYAAIDGVLYTADKKVLVAYPSCKENTSFVVPDDVEYINQINANALSILTLPLNLKIMDYPGVTMTNVNENFQVIGQNNYARRWANYFGLNFTRVNVTATEIEDALTAATDIIADLDTMTHDMLAGDTLETLTNLIENYEALPLREQGNLSPEQIGTIETVRERVAEINHTDGNVSIFDATWNVRVDASLQETDDPAYSNIEHFLDEELSINTVYDIKLTKNGASLNLPAGQTIIVVISGEFEGDTVDTVRIFHLKEDYTTEYIKPLSVTNTAITFETTSFSPFAVVAGDFSRSSGLGDVNEDEAINMQDVLLIYQAFRGKAILSSDALSVSDINGDGSVNMQDVLLVYQYFRGKISSF